MLRNSSATKLATSSTEAEATLDIISATNERIILSLSGGGRVRDFNLVYRVTYRVLDHRGVEIVPNTTISLTRILPFLDAQILKRIGRTFIGEGNRRCNTTNYLAFIRL